MLNNLGTIISTFLFGKRIGEDNFGNIYYLNKNNKRWVLYYKNNDASSVPPEWQAWLTFTVNDLPNKKYYDPRKWIRDGELTFKERLKKSFNDLNNINTIR